LEQSLERKCPFCRHPAPKTDEKIKMSMMKRIEANDPFSMSHMGSRRFYEGDHEGAFEYWTKAAELGDMGAHYKLSCLYRDGQGVEKDEKKQLHHLEQAAIGGHANARHNLGCIEEENGRRERATRHFIIAANLGFDRSLDALKNGYSKGLVSKEDFASALRGYQAAVDAAKSPQRDEAEAALQREEY
jgi:TPR repeat protein